MILPGALAALGLAWFLHAARAEPSPAPHTSPELATAPSAAVLSAAARLAAPAATDQHAAAVKIAPSGEVTDPAARPHLIARFRRALSENAALIAHAKRSLQQLAQTPPQPTSPVEQVLTALTTTPVSGRVSSGYGYRRDPVRRRRRHRRMHKGIDYAARRGTPVYAVGPGVVVSARRRGSYGRLVVVDHGHGVETRYAHLHRIRVKPGQTLTAGDQVGTVGSTGRATGPHLHFELRIDDEAFDPRQRLDFAPSGANVARLW